MQRLKKIGSIALGFILFLVMIEIWLQVASNLFLRFHKWENASTALESFVPGAKPAKTLYFLGDSFTYGVGASKPEKSYPGQFCQLLADHGNELQCKNLGFPGTSSRDHLQAMEKLPRSSLIFLRTGSNDRWSRDGIYQFKFLEKDYQIRLLKLLAIALSRLSVNFFSPNQKRELRLNLEKQVRKNGHTIILLDYSFNLPVFDQKSDDIYTVETYRILLNKGVISGPSLPTQFLSPDMSTPNDLGYGIEARVLFNEMCNLGIFNLDPSKSMPLLPTGESYFELEGNYAELKAEVVSQETMAIDRGKLRTLLSLSHQLKYVSKRADFFEQEYQALDKIIIYGFHDVLKLRESIYQYKNLSEGVIKIGLSEIDEKKLRIRMGLLKSLTVPTDPIEIRHLRDYEKMFHDYRSPEGSIETGSFRIMPEPLPLQFCPALASKLKIKPDEMGIQSDWKRIFNREIEDENFKSILPENCL